MLPWLELSVFRWASISFLFALAASTGFVPLAWSYATGNYSWAVAVSDDGRYVIAGSDDMHTYFFESDARQGLPTWIHSAQGYVRHVAISSNGTDAASSDTAGNVYFFQLGASGSPAWSFNSGSAIGAIELSSDGSRLVAGDREGNIYLFDTLRSGSPIWHGAIRGAILALSVRTSGELVATSAVGGIYFYDLALPQSSYVWKFQESISFPQLEISNAEGYIVAGGSDGNVYVINTAGELVDKQRLGGSISALSISDQPRHVIAGSTNGNVTRFLVKESLEQLDSFDAQKPITAVTISHDGERIMIASLDGTISTFTQTLTHSLWTFGTGAIVHSLSMSGNGLITAASADTGKVYVFNEAATAPAQSPLPPIAYAPIAVTLLVLGYFVLRKKRNALKVDSCRGKALFDTPWSYTQVR